VSSSVVQRTAHLLLNLRTRLRAYPASTKSLFSVFVYFCLIVSVLYFPMNVTIYSSECSVFHPGAEGPRSRPPGLLQLIMKIVNSWRHHGNAQTIASRNAICSNVMSSFKCLNNQVLCMTYITIKKAIKTIKALKPKYANNNVNHYCMP